MVSKKTIVAAAATAAGYYFYVSKNAIANRKNAAKWAANLKKDVTKKIKDTGVMDSKAVKSVISEVEKTYKKVKDLDAAEVVKAAGELKKHWDTLAQEVQKGVATGKKQATASVKKVVKKAAAKTTKTKKS